MAAVTHWLSGDSDVTRSLGWDLEEGPMWQRGKDRVERGMFYRFCVGKAVGPVPKGASSEGSASAHVSAVGWSLP